MVLLLHLNVRNNFLQNFNNECFKRSNRLSTINLNNNLIEVIQRNSFANLTNLKNIDLSNNRLKTFLGFIISSELKVLSILQNPLKVVNYRTFDKVKVDTIETNSYHVCCITPSKSKCFTNKPICSTESGLHLNLLTMKATNASSSFLLLNIGRNPTTSRHILEASFHDLGLDIW